MRCGQPTGICDLEFVQPHARTASSNVESAVGKWKSAGEYSWPVITNACQRLPEFGPPETALASPPETHSDEGRGEMWKV